MSKRERYNLGDFTDAEHLGYLGDNRLDLSIMICSLISLFGIMGGLLALVNGWLWAVWIVAAIAGVATFFMLRFSRQAQERQRKWVLDTYGLNLTPGELQQLREGKSIQRGNDWWVRDQAPWVIGFKLQQTQAVNHG